MLKRLVLIVLAMLLIAALSTSAFASDDSSAYQLPDELVHALLTRDLVQIVLGYPNTKALLTSEDSEKTYELLKMEFNGLSELSTRSDAVFELEEVIRTIVKDNYSNLDMYSCAWELRLRIMYNQAPSQDPVDNIICTPDTPYRFPVKPGTKEWIAMTTAEARKSCQIPDDILHGLTTKALVVTILEYPFIGDFFAYNSYEEWYVLVKDPSSELYFSGLTELSERPNAVQELSVLFDYYYSIENREKYLRRWGDIWIIRDLIAGEQGIDIESIRAQTLNETKPKGTFTLSNQLGTLSIDLTTLNVGLKLYSSSYTYTTIYTPGGASVNVINNREIDGLFYPGGKESLILNLEDEQGQKMRQFPSAILISGVDYIYNCHNYAWNSSARTRYWMETDSSGISQLPKYWGVNGGYTTTSSTTIGNKVVYSGNTHSGIISPAPYSGTPYTYVESKWGKLGAFIHPIGSAPYSSPYTYYKLV